MLLKKSNKLKVITIAFSVMLAIVFAYLLFISYIFSDGFRNNQEFCSKYIQKINGYKSKYGHYPTSLNQLEKPSFSYRYDPDACGYTMDSNSFSFMISIGFGVAIYSSEDNNWFYD